MQKNLSSATLSNLSLTWTGLKSNPDLRAEISATDRVNVAQLQLHVTY